MENPVGTEAHGPFTGYDVGLSRKIGFRVGYGFGLQNSGRAWALVSGNIVHLGVMMIVSVGLSRKFGAALESAFGSCQIFNFRCARNCNIRDLDLWLLHDFGSLEPASKYLGYD